MFRAPPMPLQLQSNYGQFYAALGAAALMIGIATVGVLYMVPNDTQALVALFASLGLFWLLLVAFIGWNDHRRFRRERADAVALFDGASWGEWRWTADEWADETSRRRGEYERMSRWQRFMPVMGAVVGLLIGGCVLLPVFVGGAALDERSRRFIIGLAVFFALLTFILSVVGARREHHKWKTRLERSENTRAPWVLFGPFGCYHEVDGHIPLRKLGAVRLNGKDLALTFYTRHPVGRSGPQFLQPTSMRVPLAHREDARALIKRYRAERQLDD